MAKKQIVVTMTQVIERRIKYNEVGGSMIQVIERRIKIERGRGFDPHHLHFVQYVITHQIVIFIHFEKYAILKYVLHLHHNNSDRSSG